MTLRALGRRSLLSVASLLVLLVVVFVASRAAGDPVNQYLPLGASQEARDAMRERLGLEDPMVVQLADFGSGLLTLDFGDSVWQQRPASEIVLERVPKTLQLAAVTLVFSAVIATLVAVTSAVYPRSIFGRIQRLVSLMGASMPDYWLGLVLIVVFASNLGWLPTSGSSAGARSFVLPVLTLAARPIGVMSQVMHAALVEQMSAPHAVASRARGASELQVARAHALRNAMPASLTVTIDQLIALVNGAVVVETIFGWPGLGQLAVQAIQNRDFAILFAVVTVVALAVLVFNFLTDLLYLVLDPRLRTA